ncbi:MAG: spore germination protein GerW family protein [Thermacetogeniaceae bacterium]
MIKENVDALVDHLERLINTKTIVGEPITAGDIQIIPIMSASFGYGTGTGEGTEPGKGGGKGGGGGAGGTITPTALILVQGGEAKVYSLGKKGMIEKLTEIVPECMAKFCKKETPQE